MINSDCLNQIRSQLPHQTKLIAVTKTKSIEDIQEALNHQVTDIGENYVQEFAAKYDELGSQNINWHFIGHLQTNKVKLVVGKASWIHSVDRIKLAEKIDQQAQSLGIVQNVLIQVNMSQEDQKSGCDPDNISGLLKACAQLNHIKVHGLMTIGILTDNKELIRKQFSGLARLLHDMNELRIYPTPLTELSMGMSECYQIALEEGATMIRIGSKLFGDRV